MITLLLALIATRDAAGFNPSSVDLADAIECRVTVPQLNGYMQAIFNGDIPAKRGWKKEKDRAEIITLYDLPQPIIIAGKYRTHQIALTPSQILAVLDLDDPTAIANEAGINLQPDIFYSQHVGERIVADITEPPDEEGTVRHFTTVLVAAAIPLLPGKTLYGCGYRTQVFNKGDTRPW